MAGRTLIEREIENGRMLKNNGSWMYCDKCNNTVGYLCYSTYHNFELKTKCTCGTANVFKLVYTEVKSELYSQELKLIKNRYCCNHDDSPLFSLVHKNIEEFKCKITCNECDRTFVLED